MFIRRGSQKSRRATGLGQSTISVFADRGNAPEARSDAGRTRRSPVRVVSRVARVGVAEARRTSVARPRGSGRPAPRSRERRARWRSGAHHLHEQAAGLADTAGGAQDGDLVPAGLLHRLGGGAGNAGGAEKSGHGVSGEGLWVSARLTMAIGTLPDTDVNTRVPSLGEKIFDCFWRFGRPRFGGFVTKCTKWTIKLTD